MYILTLDRSGEEEVHDIAVHKVVSGEMVSPPMHHRVTTDSHENHRLKIVGSTIEIIRLSDSHVEYTTTDTDVPGPGDWRTIPPDAELGFKCLDAPPGRGARSPVPPCNVVIRPPGRQARPLPLVEEPEYCEGEGGYTWARVMCRLDARDRDRVADAGIEIHPPRGEVWLGRVSSVDQDGPIATLLCAGAQHDYTRHKREAWYCHTAFSDWRERVADVRDNRIRVSQTNNGWSAMWLQGTTYAAGMHNGIWIESPETDVCRLEFEWNRYNQTDYHYRVYAGPIGDTPAGGDWGSAIENQPTGSGGTSGAAGVDINKAGTKALMIWFRNAVEVTPAAVDTPYHVSNIKIYGIEGITTVTAPAVINHVCDQQPGYVLPEGPEARAWIADDDGVVEPYHIDLPGRRDLDIMSGVVEFRDFELSFRSRTLACGLAAVPVYEPRVREPYYQADVLAEGVHADLVGDEIETRCDVVQVVYQGADGRLRYVLVPDPDKTSYLRAIGQGRMAEIRADTTSESLAIAKGLKFLATRNVPVSGSLRIDKPIRDMRGAEVLPCEIVARRWIRLHNTAWGTVDVPITDLAKRGVMHAALRLDEVPTELSVELAMLTKRSETQAAS